MACLCPSANTGLAGRTTSFGGDASHPACTIQAPNTFDSRIGNYMAGGYPLVLLLHGRGSTGSATQGILQLNELKNMDSGVFVLAPDGSIDPTGGVRAWNASSACCFFGGGAPNDVTYLSNMVTAAMAAYPINPKKVWIIGFSNGAFMANRLAAENSALFTGFIAVNGYYPTVDGTGFTVTNRVHATIIGSTADTSVVFTGDPTGVNVTDVPQGAYPGAASTAGFWNTHNAGGGTLQAAYDTQDFDTNVAGSETSRQRYSLTPTGGMVEFWTATGSAHQLGFNSNFRDRILSQLRLYGASLRP